MFAVLDKVNDNLVARLKVMYGSKEEAYKSCKEKYLKSLKEDESSSSASR